MDRGIISKIAIDIKKEANFYQAWGLLMDYVSNKKLTLKDIKKFFKKKHIYEGGDFVQRVIKYLEQIKFLKHENENGKVVYMKA